jgi:hypothetical protein
MRVCGCAVLQGYTKLLSVLGSNVAEFLQNLNNLHLHLSYCWPGMVPPAFRCEQVRLQQCYNGGACTSSNASSEQQERQRYGDCGARTCRPQCPLPSWQ